MPTDDDGLVFVIESTRHGRDRDNYRTEETGLVKDEGWFADRANAETRAERLNGRLRELHAQSEDRRLRERSAKERAAAKANAKIKVLREAGFKDAFVPVPPAFEPQAFEEFVSRLDGYVSYAVVAMARSEHDATALRRAD